MGEMSARDEDPSQAGTEHENHGPQDHTNEMVRYEDLSQAETPRKSYGPPYWKTGEVFGLTIKVKIPRPIALSAGVVGIATVAHIVLNLSAAMALIMGLVVVISIVTADNHPEYVTLIFKQINELAKKLKVK